MEKATGSYFNIFYEKGQEDKVEKLETILNNNIELFTTKNGKFFNFSLVKNSNNNYIFIEDIDKEFDETFKDFFYSDDLKKRIANNKKILLDTYLTLQFFLINKNNKKDCFTDHTYFKGVSEEISWDVAGYDYYSDPKNTGSFYDFMKYKKDEDKEKIFSWLKEKERFSAYCLALEETLSFLSNIDPAFESNLKNIRIAMNYSFIDLDYYYNHSYIGGGSAHKGAHIEDNSDSNKLDINKWKNLVDGYFNYIEAPKSWKDDFKMFLDNNKIIFTHKNDNSSKCDMEKIPNEIEISEDNNEAAFFSFIHEFAHYVSLKGKENNSNFLLTEFPSIYFEVIAANYLADLGYDKNYIESITKFRSSNNLEVFTSLDDIFLCLDKYKNGEKIDKEIMVENTKRLIDYFNDCRIKMAQAIMQFMKEDGKPITDDLIEFATKKEKKIDYDKAVDQEIDNTIKYFVTEEPAFISGCFYIIGTALTKEIVEKYGFDLTPKMFDITNNLEKYKLSDIVNEFSLNSFNAVDQEKEKPKVKHLKNDKKN